MPLYLNSPDTSTDSQDDNPPDRRFNYDDVLTSIDDLNPCDTTEMDGNHNEC